MALNGNKIIYLQQRLVSMSQHQLQMPTIYLWQAASNKEHKKSRPRLLMDNLEHISHVDVIYVKDTCNFI